MKRTAFITSATSALIATTGIAPAQDWAKESLSHSPRHAEWVTLKHDNRTLQAFIVYPEVGNKVPSVVVIHEIFGLSDWVRNLTDELAAAGYIAIAPDMLSGFGPNGTGSTGFASDDDRVKAVSGLDSSIVLGDINAAADYVSGVPSTNGKLAVTGFCWGGGKSFELATVRHDLAAAFVFYGVPPSNVTGITAPVYGFYAGNDERIDATIPATIAAMKNAGKRYDPVIYPGAGHGFMRAGEDPNNTNPENKTARDAAWVRWKKLLRSV
jgi:carboxymethylenebutenolidase